MIWYSNQHKVTKLMCDMDQGIDSTSFPGSLILPLPEASINRSQRSKVVYRANCWDCDSFYVGKTKRRLHDRKTEHFKALSQGCHASALADHVISTGHNIIWDHFDILTTGKSDLQCKIKETLLISELKPSLNKNVGGENLFLY